VTGPAASELAYLSRALKAPRIRAASGRLADRARDEGWDYEAYLAAVLALPGSRRKYYQFTAIDDCTRLRVLRIYERLNQQTAIQFLDYVLAKLPFRVERIQTDIQRRRVPVGLPLSRARPGHR
jgi:hypothetical protein